MNTLSQVRHNHSESCIRVKLPRRTQKVDNYLATEGYGLRFFSPDLCHISSTNIGNEFEVLLLRKCPHKAEIAYDLVRIHSLKIYTDLIEYNLVGDRKAAMLRCFVFISNLKSGDIISTGQYLNDPTFSNLQFKPLPKNFFHNIHIDLRGTSGEKIPFVSVGNTRLALMFRIASNNHF